MEGETYKRVLVELSFCLTPLFVSSAIFADLLMIVSWKGRSDGSWAIDIVIFVGRRYLNSADVGGRSEVLLHPCNASEQFIILPASLNTDWRVVEIPDIWWHYVVVEGSQ